MRWNVANGEREFAATMGELILIPEGSGYDLPQILSELRAIAVVETWRHDAPCDALTADGRAGWVLAGALRKYLITGNGQRRIVDLLMAGDLFGMSATASVQYSLQAISDDTVTLRTTRKRLRALAEQRPAIATLLRERAFIAITRLEGHSLVQGCTTALEKVSAYLLEMLLRLPPQPTRVLWLPISRYDIADHLGIAVETVSRSITALARSGVISLDSPRCIKITDARGLAHVCRRHPDRPNRRSPGTPEPALEYGER